MAPDNVSVPEPDLVRAPAPEITLEFVSAVPPAVFNVPPPAPSATVLLRPKLPVVSRVPLSSVRPEVSSID